jgi:hypothetical protein
MYARLPATRKVISQQMRHAHKPQPEHSKEPKKKALPLTPNFVNQINLASPYNPGIMYNQTIQM